MAIKTVKCLVCDVCGVLDDYGETARGLRASARSDGWVHRKGEDFCPDCKKEA